jgi:hypothetical protein
MFTIFWPGNRRIHEEDIFSYVGDDREYYYANFQWYEQERVLEITFRGILQ